MDEFSGRHSGGGGAAWRRRQRRLRSWHRHEQQTVAAALATSLHHSSRGQRKARAGEEESETKFTDKDRKTPPPQPVLFKLFDEEPGGGRPEAFAEPRPQERVLRHTAEQIGDVAPVVPALGVPEPQMVDQLVAVLKPVDSPVPDQIIAVPKILLPSRPLRAALAATQMVEQLVEVPGYKYWPPWWRNAWFDSGYILCVSFRRLYGRISTIST